MFVTCDESGINKRFFVLGSVWAPKECVSDFERHVSELRLRFKCWGEVKWEKVSDHTSDDIMCFYKEFIKAISDMNAFFRFIVIDTKKLDEQKVTEELQLKFMYLLISRNAVRGELRKEVNPSKLHILFDQFQESRQSRDEKWRQKTRSYIERYLDCEIEHFQPCDSRINSLMQLTDIVTGLICEKGNANGNESFISENRNHLASIILKEHRSKFDIWPWYPYPRNR